MPQEILWFQQVSLNCSSKMQRMTSLLVVYTLGSAQLTAWWAFSYTEEVFATHQKGFTREKEGKVLFFFFYFYTNSGFLIMSTLRSIFVYKMVTNNRKRH